MKKEKKNRTGNDHGFTLIELMVVIVIIGILVGTVAVNFMGAPDDARVNKAKMTIETLESALKLYKLDNGKYPTTEQGLQALVEPPSGAKKWREGGYLEKRKVPKDPWDHEYVYVSPGSHGRFDLTCFGADGVSGGDGVDADINNWEIE